MNELATQKLVQHLLEAHATELMLVHTLAAHIAMTPAGRYRDGLERHLEQTRDHAERIERRLGEMGADRSLVQAGYGFVAGAIGQVAAMSKFPLDLLRGMSGEEKLLKNARDECATEALEIAAYTAIESLARELGDTSTERLAASIRADEEQMLERLLATIPLLARDVVKAEVEGDPTFALGRIGAIDAAWSVAGSAARRVAGSTRRVSRKVERVADRPAGASSTRKATPSTTARASAGTKQKQQGAAKRSGAKRTTAKS